MRSKLAGGLVWTAVIALALPAAIVAVAALGNGRVGAETRFRDSPLRLSPPPPLRDPVTLSVVTFNVADAYLFTSNRRERMQAVADTLRRLDPDLVGLQEVFVTADRERLLADLGDTRLVHHAEFPAATVGNGLLILSAHPIEEAVFHRYAHSNPWWRLGEGDWWAGKGVGLVRVRLPGGGVVDLFDTHAQAGRGNPANETVRYGQMGELAEFVRAARTPGAPGFVVGDLNTREGRPDYRRALEEGGLERSMSLPSEIDHVLSVSDPRYRYRVLETHLIAGETTGPHAAIFLSRAPTLGELWRMWTGPPESTPLSDHPGYAVRIRIEPVNDPASGS